MRVRAAIAAISLIAAGAAHTGAAEAAPLSQVLAATASGFCLDILSRKVAVPAPGSKTYAFYGLAEGIPPEASTTLGRDGISLIARATLASGKASDGAFIVALGGAAGETCRLIVYKASKEDGATRTVARLVAASGGWRALPASSASPITDKHSVFRRDAAGHPYIANILAPVAASPIPLVVVVAAIPPNVTIPQGY